MRLCRNIFYLFVLNFSLSAWAYIPSSQFIFDRTASLHGKGAYKINTEVIFKDATETQIVKETWLVADGGEMVIQANGEGFHMSKLLKRGRIYWLDQDGSEHASELNADFFMTALMTRSPQDLKRLLNKWGILPVEALKERRALPVGKDLKPETEGFVRLARNNGAVQYAYGEINGTEIWIEQDHFFITKLKSPSGAVFNGQDYFIYSKNLAFPRTQTISVPAKNDTMTTVQVKVLNVSSIELSADQKKEFDPSWFRTKQQDAITVWPKHPLAGWVKSFYLRFR